MTENACPRCKGAGRTRCKTCGGSVMKTCPLCKGRKTIAATKVAGPTNTAMTSPGFTSSDGTKTYVIDGVEVKVKQPRRV